MNIYSIFSLQTNCLLAVCNFEPNLLMHCIKAFSLFILATSTIMLNLTKDYLLPWSETLPEECRATFKSKK